MDVGVGGPFDKLRAREPRRYGEREAFSEPARRSALAGGV